MITIDLSLYWVCVGAVLVFLASAWGFRRAKGALSSR